MKKAISTLMYFDDFTESIAQGKDHFATFDHARYFSTESSFFSTNIDAAALPNLFDVWSKSQIRKDSSVYF